MGIYTGLQHYSLPQYKARTKRLQERFNSAKPDSIIELEGILSIETQTRRPILTMEFENPQKINLDFPENKSYKNLIGKNVKITGKRYNIYNRKTLKFPKLENKFFEVYTIQESEFDWIKELDTPPINNLNDYQNYFSASINAESTNSFLLSLIGNNFSPTGGIGLFANIPNHYQKIEYLDLMKAYNKIDPNNSDHYFFQNRYSEAAFLAPDQEQLIKRNLPNYKEIDYLLGAPQNDTNRIVNKLTTKKAELINNVDEEGLCSPKYDQKDVEDIRYSIFYANKLPNPTFTNEVREEINAATQRLAKIINKETSVSYSPLSDIIANNKIEAIATSIAKINREPNLTTSTIKQGEKIMRTGLLNVLLIPEVSESLLQKSIELEQEFKPDLNYKKAEGIHERIHIELSLSSKTQEELWEKLKLDFSKKLFDQALNELLNLGKVYENKGRLHLA